MGAVPSRVLSKEWVLELFKESPPLLQGKEGLLANMSPAVYGVSGLVIT